MRRLTVAIWLLLASLCQAEWTERYVTVAGAGAHDGTAGNEWTLAEAAAVDHTGPIRINILKGTHALGASDLTFADTGTTSAIIWWRGYDTTIGDIDADNSLTKPAVTFTTGRFIVSGNLQWFSNLNISGAQVTASSGQVTASGADLNFIRCRVEDTAANANGNAWRMAGVRNTLFGCWGKATSSANVYLPTTTNAYFNGCHAEGGSNGFQLNGASGKVVNCVADSPAADGINVSGSDTQIEHCSIYNATGDGIEVDSATEKTTVSNTIIYLWSGSAINGSAGSTGNVMLFNNAYMDDDADTVLTNILESQQWGAVTEVSAPFTNAGSDDFSLVSGALSKGTGFPGAFENESFTGYPDRGAVQREETAASVGNINPFSNPAIR
jgi:hypothetical protein